MEFVNLFKQLYKILMSSKMKLKIFKIVIWTAQGVKQ